jgi:alkyl sulfatase BDS1-like metallo-beta-lactamase superfamily hydrolase
MSQEVTEVREETIDTWFNLSSATGAVCNIYTLRGGAFRDPQDAEARAVRATAARALGQCTSSANARGFYITEALQIEGQLLVDGRPMTLARALRLDRQ